MRINRGPPYSGAENSVTTTISVELAVVEAPGGSGEVRRTMRSSGTTSWDRLGAQGELDHVTATTDSVVEQHLDLASDGGGAREQGTDRRRRPVEIVAPRVDKIEFGMREQSKAWSTAGSSSASGGPC
jgi:hypothetical protein